MADSILKDLLDVLNAYGSWTVEPSWVNATDYKGPLDMMARKLKSATTAMCFILMPGSKKPNHAAHRLGHTWTFEFWVFYFDKVHTDANRDKLETFLTEVDACLLATTVTGFDENYVDDTPVQEMTIRDNDHFLFVGNIIVEDWIA